MIRFYLILLQILYCGIWEWAKLIGTLNLSLIFIYHPSKRFMYVYELISEFLLTLLYNRRNPTHHSATQESPIRVSKTPHLMWWKLKYVSILVCQNVECLCAYACLFIETKTSSTNCLKNICWNCNNTSFESSVLSVLSRTPFSSMKIFNNV